VFTGFAPSPAWICVGVDGVDISSHSDNGGAFRRGRGVDGDVVGEDAVDEGPETDGGGLRSLRIKSPLVVCGGGGGSSFVGLDEREEMLVRSLLVGGVEVGVDVVVVLPRKRRTPFIVKGDMRCDDVLAQRAES
jgi:hypothetical protein